METEGLYPWLMPAWGELMRRLDTGNMPHALMLRGPEGTGKLAFARQLSLRLLCAQPAPQGEACGQCHGCRMLLAGAHPDFVQIGPAEGKTRIRVEQIRELIGFMTLSRSHGQYRVALIEPADMMNDAAANSLLKTLEEPPGNAVLILVTAYPARLPATIRSRCQSLRMPLPSRPEAERWLKERLPADRRAHAGSLLALSHGSPLDALASSEGDLISVWGEQRKALMALMAGRVLLNAVLPLFKDRPMDIWLAWLQVFALDALRWRLCGDQQASSGIAPAEDIRGLGNILGTQGLSDLLPRLARWRSLAHANLNAALYLEDVLLGLRMARSGAQPPNRRR